MMIKLLHIWNDLCDLFSFSFFPFTESRFCYHSMANQNPYALPCSDYEHQIIYYYRMSDLMTQNLMHDCSPF